MNTRYKKQNTFVLSLQYAFIFILLFWAIAFLQILGFNFSSYGILPRTQTGLIGIFTAPFIHANIQHLSANSLPFFVLSLLLFLFYHKNAPIYFISIWITSGILTWLIGRASWHIGASGIIYGLMSFLIIGGILSWKSKLVLVSIIVFFLYSGLIWGIFPGEREVSWEGHLSGAIGGVLWAFVYKNQLKRYNI